MEMQIESNLSEHCQKVIALAYLRSKERLREIAMLLGRGKEGSDFVNVLFHRPTEEVERWAREVVDGLDICHQ